MVWHFPAVSVDMTALITGNFQERALAQVVLAELRQAGFSAAQLSLVPVGESGPQDAFPMGGYQEEEAGAENAGVGAASGAAIGGALGIAAGLVTFPLLGPGAAAVGAGVGAYAGSLLGALSTLSDESNADPMMAPGALERAEPRRQSGNWVVAAADTASEQATAIGVLRDHAATDIERTEGHFSAGQWHDFDALAPIRLAVD
jgi:hypothetical protein